MLLHIDWNWIWQRPQAIAVALARAHEVRVVYRLNPHRTRLTRNANGPKRQPLLPVPERAFPKLARRVHRIQLSLITKYSNPDIIWLTHPDLVHALPENLWGKSKIIYDCMDYAAGFAVSQAQRTRIFELEDLLLSRADAVICSSSALVKSLSERTCPKKITLIENGLDESWLEKKVVMQEQPSAPKEHVNAYYFGTISTWIDWDLIQRALEAIDSLQFHLFGPVEYAPAILHPRLNIHAPVRHSMIPSLSRAADCFVLPFKKNELINHVNPVKLYEYMALQRPIIAVDYPETRRFHPWVSVYSSSQQFVSLLNDVCTGELHTDVSTLDERDKFLRSSTWMSRMSKINSLIEALLTDRQSAPPSLLP
jgi:teichuronic acid biosynthesis glycosyltransferase TuaH